MKFWKKVGLGAGLALVASALPIMAQDLSPVSSMLNRVVNAMTGPIGKAIATLAVIGAGFMMFTGRMNWIWALLVLLGAVLVFSAKAIVAGF